MKMLNRLQQDRDYWENKATNNTVGLADDLLGLVKEIDEKLELKYNKFYIGLAQEGHPFNFVTFRPRKKNILLTVKIPQSDPRIQSVNMGQGGYGIGQAYLWYKRDGTELDHAIHVFAFITADFTTRMVTKSFLGMPKPLLRTRNGKILVENIPISRISSHKVLKYLKFFNVVRLASKVHEVNLSDTLDKPAIYRKGEWEELIGIISTV